MKCQLKLTQIILGLLCMIATLPAYSQPIYTYETEKVAEDIYVLRSVRDKSKGNWVTGNIIVIINEKDVFVVDSGFFPAVAKDAVKEIKKLTPKPVKYLFNTHWHGDHWQGNEVFAEAYPGVEIISSDLAYKGMKTKGMIWINKFYPFYLGQSITNDEEVVKTGAYKNGDKPTADELAQLKLSLPFHKREVDEIKQVKPTFPTLTYSEKMTIRRGNREIQLHYLGWGNTTGDGIVYLPNEKILIPGDLIVYPSQYESGAFSAEWMEVYKKLKEFEFTSLIPGHGQVLKDSQYIEFLIAVFEEVIVQVNTAVYAGKSLDETKAAVTDETVKAVLSKNEKFAEFIKNFHPSFVQSAVINAFPKANEGKL